jgi:hypothetical protein
LLDQYFFNNLSNLPLDLHYARSGMGVWLFAHLVILFFHLVLNNFSYVMHTNLGFFHPLALGLSHCIHGQPLDPMGIYFFHCIHHGERTVSHDAMWDAFASIMKNVCFHAACEQTHILLPPTF